jgi:hypothetical protein
VAVVLVAQDMTILNIGITFNPILSLLVNLTMFTDVGEFEAHAANSSTITLNSMSVALFRVPYDAEYATAVTIT